MIGCSVLQYGAIPGTMGCALTHEALMCKMAHCTVAVAMIPADAILGEKG